MKPYGMTIQMKVTELYFHVVLLIMLYKMVLNFKFIDEMLRNLFAIIWTLCYLFFSILQNEIWRFLSNFDLS